MSRTQKISGCFAVGLELADEPTTALDVTVQRQILSLIARMRDETGAAIILITHDVGVVAELCDWLRVCAPLWRRQWHVRPDRPRT